MVIPHLSLPFLTVKLVESGRGFESKERSGG